jgi:hypothetical protein
MAICLGINDDIQQTFTRYESFKKQTKPKTFISSFLGEYASSNMINNLENSKQNIVVNNQMISGSNNQQKVNLIGFDDNMDAPTTNNFNYNNNNNNNDKGKNYVKDLNDLFN